MTHFTVPPTYPRVQHTTASGVLTYSFPFPIFDDDDLSVFIDATPLNEYSVTGLRQASGGSITFASPLEPSRTLTILRARQIKRLTDFADGGEFRADTVNDELDSLTMAAQQLDEAGSRALHIAPPVKGVDMVLPAPMPARRAILTDEEADGFEYSAYDPDTTVEIAQDALDVAHDAKDIADSALAAVQNVGAGSQRAWGPFVLEEGVQGYGPLPLAPPHVGAIELFIDGVAQPLKPGAGLPDAWSIGDEHGPGLTIVLTAPVKQTPSPGEIQAGLPIFGTVLGGIAEAAISLGAIQERHIADNALNLLGPKFGALDPNIWRFGTDGAGRIKAFGAPLVMTDGTVNVLDYGALADDATDNWSAFQAAFAAAAELGRGVKIPASKYRYKLLQQLDVQNFPAAVFGNSLGLSRLWWPAEATSRGVKISSNDDAQFIDVHGLTFETGGKGGEALQLDFSGQVDNGVLIPGKKHTWDRWSPRANVHECFFLGTSSRSNDVVSTGWDVGVRSKAGIYVRVKSCDFVGWKSGASGSTAAFIFSGLDSSYENGHPVGFTVDGSRVTYAQNGIVFDQCEGGEVTDTYLLSCQYGVYATSNYGHPLIKVRGCDTACYVSVILLDGMNACLVDGNFLAQPADSTVSCFAVLIRNTATVGGIGYHRVRGNHFHKTATSSSALMRGVTIDGMTHNVIEGNTFVGQDVGVHLQTGCINSRVDAASDLFNGCTITVLNEGTANEVA